MLLMVTLSALLSFLSVAFSYLLVFKEPKACLQASFVCPHPLVCHGLDHAGSTGKEHAMQVVHTSNTPLRVA
jgi:hypothetical protein